MVEFCLTCGLPATGKTTWAKEKIDEGYVWLSSDEIRKALEEIKYVMNIQSKYAPNSISKNDRIFRCSTDIIANFRFKTTSKRNAEYSMAMRQMFSFTILGKKQHEDAVDSLAMMSMARAIMFRGASFEIFRRPI